MSENVVTITAHQPRAGRIGGSRYQYSAVITGDRAHTSPKYDTEAQARDWAARYLAATPAPARTATPAPAPVAPAPQARQERPACHYCGQPMTRRSVDVGRTTTVIRHRYVCTECV